LPFLHIPPLFGAPVGIMPLEFRRDLWSQKTRRIAVSCGIKYRR